MNLKQRFVNYIANKEILYRMWHKYYLKYGETFNRVLLGLIFLISMSFSALSLIMIGKFSLYLSLGISGLIVFIYAICFLRNRNLHVVEAHNGDQRKCPK